MTASELISRTTLAERATEIAAEVAGPASAEVDRLSRFPSEAFDALKKDGQLSALVPTDLGGGGHTLSEVAEATFALARQCASTAMIYAMHHLQVATLVNHADSDYFRRFLEELSRDQLLIASATTEIGVGGDIRSSICAVEQSADRFHLEKQAPVVSYGSYADAVLATARRTPDSPPNDQVMVLCQPPGLVLEQLSEWNALGFRGTCSSGYRLIADGDVDAVVPTPFETISAITNLPTAHILWGHVWLGLAAEAMTRARTFVQKEARKSNGATSGGPGRLAELHASYLKMAALVRGAAHQYETLGLDSPALGLPAFAASMNALKVSASTMVVEIVSGALMICGIPGYSETSPFSMGRLIRDAHGAALMVNNDRILLNNAQLLLVDRGQL